MLNQGLIAWTFPSDCSWEGTALGIHSLFDCQDECDFTSWELLLSQSSLLFSQMFGQRLLVSPLCQWCFCCTLMYLCATWGMLQVCPACCSASTCTHSYRPPEMTVIPSRLFLAISVLSIKLLVPSLALFVLWTYQPPLNCSPQRSPLFLGNAYRLEFFLLYCK